MKTRKTNSKPIENSKPIDNAPVIMPDSVESNISTINTFDLDRLIAAVPADKRFTTLKTEKANNVLTAYTATVANAAASRNHADVVLSLIVSSMSDAEVKAAGFKSVGQMVEAALNKTVSAASVTGYVNAGKMYRDVEIPDCLKRQTKANLAELASLYNSGHKAELIRDAEKLAGMSQSQLRDYRKQVKGASTDGKVEDKSLYYVDVTVDGNHIGRGELVELEKDGVTSIVLQWGNGDKGSALTREDWEARLLADLGENDVVVKQKAKTDRFAIADMSTGVMHLYTFTRHIPQATNDKTTESKLDALKPEGMDGDTWAKLKAALLGAAAGK